MTLESLAYYIHSRTGKEQLLRICSTGLALEILWHSWAEPRVFGTPTPTIRSAILRASVMWPSVFSVTSLGLKWAERTVSRIEESKFDDGRGQKRIAERG